MSASDKIEREFTLIFDEITSKVNQATLLLEEANKLAVDHNLPELICYNWSQLKNIAKEFVGSFDNGWDSSGCSW